MDMDDAYSNGAYIEAAETYPEVWADAAREYRGLENSLGRARLNVPYGDGQALDLFYPSGRPIGLAVFVHGGYWMAFDRTDWSHFAEGLAQAGWAVAMPSYPLAPGASLPEIKDHIAKAIECAADIIPGPIVLTGHSAGGHLVARMAMTDSGLNASVTARIQKIVPISPVADLRPLLQTKMRGPLALTPAVVEGESPALHPKAVDVPVHIWVGGDERPAFLDQAQWLAQAWGAALTVDPGRHHFDVIDGLLSAESALVKVLTNPN